MIVSRNISINIRVISYLVRKEFNPKEVLRRRFSYSTPSTSNQENNYSNNELEKTINKFGELTKDRTDSELLLEDKLMDKEIEMIMDGLRKLDDEIAMPFLGSGLVKEHVKRLSIDEMESPDTTLSREPKFRTIIYTEGELDKTDLTKPPSRFNPHPFDLSNPEIAKVLPPTHARSLAAYVNHSKVLQNLLDLGVDLLEIDTKTKLGRYLVRMDWDKDVFPKLAWLVQNIGVNSETLGKYLTRNPYFLIQNLDDIKARINYLGSKKFKKNEISKIVIENRFWLNTDVKTIDARLGWVQRQFRLTGDAVRSLIIKEPRVIQFGLGPVQRIVLMFNKELSFSPKDIRKMLMKDPRVFMMDYDHLVRTYNYLALVMDISNKLIVEYPFVLRCQISDIRKRHEFLRKVKRAIYDPELPEYVSLEKLLQPSDKQFAEKVAGIKVENYNKFLKTL